MTISLVAVGAKITAAITNAIINAVNQQGLTGIIPTSVAGTGVSVGASGKVTFTAASTITVNGCFTGMYDNYLIVLDAPTTSTSLSLTMQLANTGTPSATSNYAAQVDISTGTSITTAAVAATTFWGLGGAGAIIDARIELLAPFLTSTTRGSSDVFSTPNPLTSSASRQYRRLLHQAATSFDGFQIVTSTGNATGTIRIYGYNND